MKIRVLEVLATLRRAGAEKVAVSLACGLPRALFETAIVSLYDRSAGDFEPALDEAGVRVWRLGKKPGFDRRMWGRLSRVIGEFRPSVIHTHSYVLRYALPFVGRAAMVHTVHNLAEREVDVLGRLIHRVGFRLGVLPVAVSGEVAQSFRRVYGSPPAATIPNGVDLARYGRNDARAAWRQSEGFGAQDLLIVSVARLEPQKDPLTLVEAFGRTFAAEPHCHLLLAGAGSLENGARELAARYGVSERVRLLGVRSDVAELLAAADVFALASRWEGSPVAVLEAMASGLPVVATAVGGVPGLVTDQTSGFLVPPADAAALGTALRVLAADPAMRREMGEAARAKAGGFAAEAMLAAYAELFRRAVREES